MTGPGKLGVRSRWRSLGDEDAEGDLRANRCSAWGSQVQGQPGPGGEAAGEPSR